MPSFGIEKIFAGTGHRPNKLGGYTYAIHKRMYEVVKEYLTSNRPDRILSGMALGWDMAIAQAAIDLTIPFTAVIPFKGQEAHWPEASQNYYFKLLDKASNIVIVSSGDYTAAKMQLRNEWMVDECTLLLALWDGSTGGTGNCIKYAKSKDTEIINLYDKWKQLTLDV